MGYASGIQNGGGRYASNSRYSGGSYGSNTYGYGSYGDRQNSAIKRSTYQPNTYGGASGNYGSSAARSAGQSRADVGGFTFGGSGKLPQKPSGAKTNL
jgi:hypothetical protein